MNKLSTLIKIIALALILSLGLSYALAWTAPASNPPTGNAAAPLNVSATAQIKSGDLTLTRLFTTASSSIGTTAQTQTLTVAGTIGATGDICTAAGGGKCLGTMSAGGAIDPAPIGSIVSYAGATAPSGYLLCNGAAVSRTAYAALFAAIGTTYGVGDGSTTFNLPDLRGEFVRGLDSGRGVDTGRVLGSWQADEFRSHVHNMGRVAGGYSGLQFTWGGGGMADIAPNTTAAGGVETRPRNVAMNYIIKAVANSEMVLVATSTFQGLGYGQTWQNVAASRVLGTVYTNSTGKPIFVNLYATCGSTGSGNSVALTVDGVTFGATYASLSNAAVGSTVSAIVPPGSTYKAVSNNGLCGVQSWSELR